MYDSERKTREIISLAEKRVEYVLISYPESYEISSKYNPFSEFF